MIIDICILEVGLVEMEYEVWGCYRYEGKE